MAVDGPRHASAPLSREKPDTHCKETGWSPGPILTAAENFAPTGIRSPERRIRSQSPYRLRYPGPQMTQVQTKNSACWSKQV